VAASLQAAGRALEEVLQLAYSVGQAPREAQSLHLAVWPPPHRDRQQFLSLLPPCSNSVEHPTSSRHPAALSDHLRVVLFLAKVPVVESSARVQQAASLAKALAAVPVPCSVSLRVLHLVKAPGAVSLDSLRPAVQGRPSGRARAGAELSASPRLLRPSASRRRVAESSGKLLVPVPLDRAQEAAYSVALGAEPSG